jgi:hypothetical protein
VSDTLNVDACAPATWAAPPSAQFTQALVARIANS